MTKDEFIARWRDELTGFVLQGFLEGNKADAAAKGRWMILQMDRVVTLLGQMQVDAPAAVPVTVEKTVEQLAEELIVRWSKCGPESQKKIVEKMRVAFTPSKDVKK